MEMINAIRKNERLSIIDAETGKEYFLDDLLHEISDALPRQGLIFVYTNNTIADVSFYLSLLSTPLTIALLNRKVTLEQKLTLEECYRPEVIYDPDRKNLDGYVNREMVVPGFTWHLFENRESTTKIHPKIKLLLSTSGSTGSPKFVKLSTRNIYENARSIAEYLPIAPTDIVPLNLPINYSYGLSILHSNALKAKTLICGLPDLLSPSFWELLNTYKFSTLAGVPYMYEMMARLGFLEQNYPSLKYITEAGGNLNLALKEQYYDWCKNQGVAFYIMYGQTEATARISYNHVNEHPDKIASIGKAIPRGSLNVDSDTEELLYEGPNIFGGYAKNRSDLDTWQEQKVLRTGDLAKKDKDGFFFITGRLKRIVKLFGNRVNLDEVERYLKNAMPGVLIACSNLNDKYLLVSTNTNLGDKEKIIQLLKSKYQFPVQVIKLNFIKELPLSSNGKVSYEQLKENYNSGQ